MGTIPGRHQAAAGHTATMLWKVYERITTISLLRLCMSIVFGKWELQKLVPTLRGTHGYIHLLSKFHPTLSRPGPLGFVSLRRINRPVMYSSSQGSRLVIYRKNQRIQVALVQKQGSLGNEAILNHLFTSVGEHPKLHPLPPLDMTFITPTSQDLGPQAAALGWLASDEWVMTWS